jgi:hypothetical protein
MAGVKHGPSDVLKECCFDLFFDVDLVRNEARVDT